MSRNKIFLFASDKKTRNELLALPTWYETDQPNVFALRHVSWPHRFNAHVELRRCICTSTNGHGMVKNALWRQRNAIEHSTSNVPHERCNKLRFDLLALVSNKIK